MPSFLPPRPFRDTLLLRVAVVWAVLRAMGMAGMGAVEGSWRMAPLEFLAATPWVVAALLLVVRFDTERRGEALFLANLGVGFRRLGAAVTGVVLLLEGGLAALLAWAAGSGG